MTERFPFDPPPPLVTRAFVIRPQRLSDNDLDYDAVMASAEALRRWSGSAWPEDDFTPDANAGDLRRHIAEHGQRAAFGFTIATPDDSLVLGSLYVNPLAPLLADYQAEPMPGYDARIDVWTRTDAGSALLGAVIGAARGWLARSWSLAGAVFGARQDCPELEQAYTAARMRLRARLRHPASGRVHLLYG